LWGTGEVLAASTGGGPSELWGRLGRAGIIVVLLARGVTVSQALRSERVGEAGGDWSTLSVALSIALPMGCGDMFSGGGAEHLRVGGAGPLGQCLKSAVCSPPQLTQRDGEEEQQPGLGLRLQLLGQVGLGHEWFERVWSREQSGHTRADVGQLGATWLKPQQFLHGVYQFEE